MHLGKRPALTYGIGEPDGAPLSLIYVVAVGHRGLIVVAVPKAELVHNRAVGGEGYGSAVHCPILTFSP